MDAQREKLLKAARAASSSPGVYLMKAQDDQILYVGKAKNLSKRLSSYFQPAGPDSVRIGLLVANIDHFEEILTETESEALILENTLIKRHRPKFNIRLKDDKAYPYIKICSGVPTPRLEWTRRVVKDGARYFGPFPSAWSARQVMRLLNETLRLRDCSDNTFRHRSRPCLLHQMDRCSAPCVKLISPEEYRRSIDTAIGILEGKGDEFVRGLERSMHEAAEKEEYENAAFYRDQIHNIQLITETQGVLKPGTDKNQDVIAVAQLDHAAHGVILEIRKGLLLSVQHVQFQNYEKGVSIPQLLYDFIARRYLDLDPDQRIFDEILVPEMPMEGELLNEVLEERIRVPQTKEEKQLSQVAIANAKHALESWASKITKEGHGIQALEEIQDKLHLAEIPLRMECYDISNIQGTDPVASRVVFVDGSPDKNLYRRYKIKTVEGQNDFAMMREVLQRRFRNASDAFPQLLVVDGGKGQLSQAVTILEELNIQGVEAVGLAKARTESDFRSKDVQTSEERIFIPNRKNPVPLKPHTGAYRLLTHIRDEAHRFAIQYHRLRRKKRNFDAKD